MSLANELAMIWVIDWRCTVLSTAAYAYRYSGQRIKSLSVASRMVGEPWSPWPSECLVLGSLDELLSDNQQNQVRLDESLLACWVRPGQKIYKDYK